MTIWPRVSIDALHEYSMCFACGQSNPIGLKLKFEWDGKTARAAFTPTEFYQSWPGVVHGGIILCLLDEAMSQVALFEGDHCVTAKIEAKLNRPASLNETLVVTASVTRKTRKLIETKAAVSLPDGTLIAEGAATQFIAQPTNKKSNPGSNTRK